MTDRLGSLRIAVTILLSLAFAVLAIGYVFGPNPPFGFYYDLGVNIAASHLMDISIRSLADLKDAMGWSSWDNGPQFTFNPMLAYAVLLPLTKILAHNAVDAVKAMQVLDTVLAFFGMTFLYLTVRPASAWAKPAGALYALLPLTMLQIQGNVEFGLSTALAPLALGACLRIVRACGAAGLPLCAALCSVAGACIAIEYFFFLTLPIYLAAAFAVRARARRWLPWFALGLAVSVLAVSYCILPTLASRAFFSDPAQRLTSLQAGQYVIFSGTPLSMASLLLNEALIVNPPFNASADVAWAAVAGVVLWVCALLYVVHGITARSLPHWERSLAVICGICILLAFGANLPFGDLLWGALSRIPIAAYIRTPDRFIALPAVCIVLWAVLFAESSLRTHVYARRVIVAAFAGAALCLAIFGFQRHVLQTDPALVSREPDLRAANERAARLGGRNTPLAFVRNGSIYYFALYGYSAPQLRVSWDFAGRYLLDGIAAAGILSKANVHSIVATPNWTTDGQGLPNPLWALSRSALLNAESVGANSVYVYRVRNTRDWVYPVATSCYEGGPGNFDRVEAQPAFTGYALVRDSSACSHSILSDFDPRDALATDIHLKRWSGRSLFPRAPQLKDQDYAFVQGRAFLNYPWYRNAIDGDAALFDTGGAVALTNGISARMRLRLAPNSFHQLNVRIACRQPTVLSLIVQNAPAQQTACRPLLGFQWLTLPVRTAQITTTAAIFVRSGAIELHSETPWAAALDGVVLTGSANAYRRIIHKARLTSVVLSAARFRDSFSRMPAESPGSVSLVERHDFIKAVGATAATSERPALTAYSSHGSLVFQWNGPPGPHIVSGAAWISGKGSALELLLGTASQGERIAVYDPAAVSPSTVAVQAMLQTGERFRFRTILPARDPDASASFVRAQVSSLTPTSRTDDGAGTQAYVWDFAHSPAWFLPVSGGEDLAGEYGLTASSPMSVELRAAGFSNTPTQASLEIDASGSGNGLAELACAGTAPVSLGLHVPDAVIGVGGRNLSSCTVTLRLADQSLHITKVQLIARGAHVGPRIARRWVPKGDYAIRAFSRSGVPIQVALKIDGRAVGRFVRVGASGWHAIELGAGGATLETLTLQAVGWKPPRLAQLHLSTIGTARWHLTVSAPQTLEAAVFPDGWWRLASDRVTYGGVRCDLVNTCFGPVKPGRYALIHRWAPSTIAGFCLSFAVWIAGLVCAGLAYRRSRRTR